MHHIANTWMWIGFSLFVILALFIDTVLLAGHHHQNTPRKVMRQALIWTGVWISCALLFNLGLWLYLRHAMPLEANQIGLDFLTGYLIEKSLSVDNLFAFYMVFSVLRIPPKLQHRVFAFGIWSAIVLRLAVILLFSWLVGHFDWLLYVMGAFLLITGIKMLVFANKETDLKDSAFYQFLKKHVRFTDRFKGQQFFLRINKLWYATPLMLALILIEFSDIIFAFDSIPAIFAITRDPFIVWSSNIFAILGLRALYFLLAGMVERFKLLKFGIAIILMFIGVKMIVEPWLHIPVTMSLGFILGIIALFVVVSMRQTRLEGK